MSEIDATVSDSKSTTSGRAAWTLLIIAWAFFIIPIPGLGWIGWVLNLVAFILAIVALSQGGVKAGIWQLLASLIADSLLGNWPAAHG
jgi:hypothetical protein